ncbi:hypothetical protein POM88_053942 [Heracleum sosnowskyi]|uniref:Uncharacterized protein n=1 Tax=Heracleum sosnowskyi TaxID=360622 RepID=A0AAD8GME5_9APIA|nr:hypothetical protein POM88_055023 [Heracleum sosnowskyi]KAK1351801.1 hypothetical protein POM88_053942 [Heracleum sosnowskyi]
MGEQEKWQRMKEQDAYCILRTLHEDMHILSPKLIYLFQYGRAREMERAGCLLYSTLHEDMHILSPSVLMAPKPKHTLTDIVRLRWDENTLNTKGVKREAFYNDCIKEFKSCESPSGRNFKHFLNKEKSRLMKHVNKLLKSGYSKEQIDITTLKPYYFSQRAWNSICDHWGTPQFQTKSINGTKARELVEFTPRSGAKPFDHRRSKEIQLKKDLQVTLQAIPPKGGRVFLRPNETLGEIVEAREIAKWAKQTVQPAPVDIPDDIFTMMSKILDAVQQMVHSLLTYEVKQSVLDEQETLSEKAKGKKAAVLDNRGHNEGEEDPDAHLLFPLF